MGWNITSTRVLILLSLVFLLACAGAERASNVEPTPYTLDRPFGFPEMDIPEDNPMTVEAVALGKALFFDPILSKDYSVSCASCHLPERAFADTVAISAGVDPAFVGFRNSYSLANVGYQEALFMEGGVPHLELQVLAPMGEASEMDISMKEFLPRIEGKEEHQAMSRAAYGKDIDLWVITRAIAAFERTLISGTSPWDEYLAGDQEAADEQVIAGYEVFNAKGCSSCHSGFLFTDQDYHNIGLSLHYEDPGRARLTHAAADSGAFKTPSLRNVALSAPYMHDGRMETLEEVLDHFASGGAEHYAKSMLVSPFDWEEGEKEALLAFLNSLTDYKFVSDKRHRP